MKHILSVILVCALELICTSSVLPQNAIVSAGPKSSSPSSVPFSVDSLVGLLTEDISIDSIAATIRTLQSFGTRYIYAPNHDSVGDLIRNRFLSLGITDVRFDTFSVNGYPCRNVIASLPGSSEPENEIIIGAHPDSYAYVNPLNAPGADDNASGIAAIIEIARVIMNRNVHPRATLRFMTFDAEELGIFGSEWCAEQAKAKKTAISLVISLDVIAYTPKPLNESLLDYQCFPKELLPLISDRAHRYCRIPANAKVRWPMADGLSFYNNGIPVVAIFENVMNPMMHTDQDIIDNCRLDYCQEATKSACGILATAMMLPGTVRDLTVKEPGKGSSLIVQWKKSSSTLLRNYRLFIGRSPGQYNSSLPVIDTVIVVKNLQADSVYYFGVAVENSDSTQGFLTETYGTPRIFPRTPTVVAADPLPNKVRLHWNPNNEMDLLGYYVYRALSPQGTAMRLMTIPLQDTIFVDSTLPAGQFGYYSVAAVDSGNNVSELSQPLRSRVVSLDRGILLVSETQGGDGSPGNPTKTQVDQYYRELLHGFTVTNLAADSIGMLDLADLGAYSSIVWHEDDLVDVSAPYLWRTDISKYLNFGGKILYTGYLPTKAFANTSSYPTILQPGEMVFDDLGIFKTDRKLFSRFSGALPAVSGYPALNCDSSKTDAALEYHLTNIESIVPTSSARTIYDYDSRYDSASLMGSMKGLPVGLEFTGSGHKAVVLAFPLYFLNQAQASSVMKYVLLDRFSEVLKVTEDDKAIPKEFLLKQNYPNPFNPTTTFLFELSAAGPVRLMVYDLLGKEVARLIDSRLESGRYQLMWDASRIPSGVYFYSLASGAYTITKRMVLLK